jgi:hypothetical protein
MRKHFPRPATAISLLALFVALGGTSYAAFSLPKNSVGTKQLQNGAVTRSKVKLSKLGPVPSAGTANSASSAATAGALNGVAAKNFAPVIYAHVLANGTIDGYEEWGFGAGGGATVTHGAGSAYCISNLPFSVRGGTVSIDYGLATAPAGEDSAELWINQRGLGSGDCTTPVEVATFSNNGTSFTPEPFYVVLYGCGANGGTCNPVPTSARR